MKKKTVRKQPKKDSTSTIYYVAVVHKAWGFSQRPEGDWASFINRNQKDAVNAAMNACAKWEAEGFGPYQIWVGTLTAAAEESRQFQLKPIPSSPYKIGDKLNLASSPNAFVRNSSNEEHAPRG